MLEMASVPLDKNEDRITNNHVQHLVSTNSIDCGEVETLYPYADDLFGEPEILPRIGDEYQAQLPPIFGHYVDTEVNNKFCIGLPIPLTWISPNNTTYSNGDIEPSNEKSRKKILKFYREGKSLVPGLVGECWRDAEKAIFLLGLYIFEKNFVEVSRFVETKEMGSILSYYYGKFYESEEYRRWSKCRKTKSKKCVYGQRIFLGLRQQELLSRLLPKVSEDCKSSLLEVSKTFGDEKMSLVDYVFSLKAMVGTKMLVEVIGVGTGKQDLTGMALEPPKSNQTNPIRPEIPTGKACSSLTTSEIVKFLSGDYRLSKARSNDLFWEAVWPRLLARGWHSEQPKDMGYTRSLVFLMPGFKKFSRRKLVKGEQYFDSVTDVLSKVAKEPGLIDLESDEVDGHKKKEEDASSLSTSTEEEDADESPTRERHFYLQPRTPNRNAPTIKFMVVDTSLYDGKVRELRTLPSEISNILISFDPTEDSDEDDNTLEENSGESNTMNDNRKPSKSAKTSVPVKNKKDLNEFKKSRKSVKAPVNQKRKEINGGDHAALISKRCRKLSANSNEETEGTGPVLQDGTSSVSSYVRDFNSCQDKLSCTSSLKGSPGESIEFVTVSPETQLLIDINLPRVSQDVKNHTIEQEVEARQEQQPDVNPRRQSTRNRPITARALEALAGGYLTVNRRPKRKDNLASRPSKRARGVIGPNESTNSSMASQIEEAENISSKCEVVLDATEEESALELNKKPNAEGERRTKLLNDDMTS